jgi:ankyrin repeat protein
VGDLYAIRALVRLRDEYGWSVDTDSDIPICVAAKNGHIEAVRLLNELEADVDKADRDALTALEWAARAGHEGVVEFLMELTKNSENLALHHAVTGPDPAVAVAMLLRCGMKVDTQDSDGKTALHLAASEGNEELVDMLLRHRADVRKPTKYGSTPLHWAVWGECENKKVVQLLLWYQADVTVQDHDGRTALDWAVQKGYTAVAELLRGSRRRAERGGDIKIVGWRSVAGVDP